MSAILKEGATKVDYLQKAASTAIAINAVLTFDGSGGVIHAVSTSTRIAGVSLKAVVSTDSDYALQTRIPVVIPTPESVFEMDVTTGTLTAAMVGNQYDLDSHLGINVNATSHKQVTIVAFLSATKALVKFNGAYEYANAS